MKVFNVVVMDDFCKRLSLEPFPTLELALMRTAWIARHVYGVNPVEAPHPQKTGFYTDVEYVVYQDNESVMISVLEQEIRTALPHFRGDHNMDNVPVTPPTLPVAPVDDPKELTLPGGWLHDGTPVKMETLLDDPESVQPFDLLSTAQKFALTIARISKRPNFAFPTNIGVLVQSSALSELKRKTEYGWEIVDHEMGYLDDVRDENTVFDIDD